MLEIDDQLDVESVAKLHSLIQGAAVGCKKDVKLEGFLFDVASVFVIRIGSYHSIKFKLFPYSLKIDINSCLLRL